MARPFGRWFLHWPGDLLAVAEGSRVRVAFRSAVSGALVCGHLVLVFCTRVCVAHHCGPLWPDDPLPGMHPDLYTLGAEPVRAGDGVAILQPELTGREQGGAGVG